MRHTLSPRHRPGPAAKNVSAQATPSIQPAALMVNAPAAEAWKMPSEPKTKRPAVAMMVAVMISGGRSLLNLLARL